MHFYFHVRVKLFYKKSLESSNYGRREYHEALPVCIISVIFYKNKNKTYVDMDIDIMYFQIHLENNNCLGKIVTFFNANVTKTLQHTE